MLGDFFAWIKRLSWITIILLVIAPAAAGIIFHTVFHDLSIFSHAAHIHIPHPPHKLKVP